MAKRLPLAAVAAVLVGLTVVAAPEGTSSAQPTDPCTEIFTFTGGTDTFTVPAGVTTIFVDAFGAQGGSIAPGVNNDGMGGLGAGLTGAEIPVTPGQTVEILVGGVGQGRGAGQSPGGAGGFNGGGDGGDATRYHGGAGGGGASTVLIGGVPFLIAAGGGGGAHGGSGGAGGTTGVDGTSVGTGAPNGGGLAGGNGGAGGAGSGIGEDGGNGSFAAGGPVGAGGTGGIATADNGDGGGGGGGGLTGGGGGGGGTATADGGGSGGGGGNNGAVPGFPVTSLDGVRQGDGRVDITYDDPACPADLAITKVAAPTEPEIGDDVTYTLTVTNNGPDDATGVTVTDNLPDQVEYVSDTCGGANVPPWTWTIGDLANGDTATCTITVTVVDAGAVTNTSIVTGDEPDPDQSNNEDTSTITVPPRVADLAVVKTGTLDADAGQITYTLTVTNNGPDDATGVLVTDDLPDQVEYVSDTCAGRVVPPWTWDVGAVASGASATCDLTVDVVAAGEIANVSEVTGNEEDPDLDNNEDEEVIVVIDLAIEKTAALSAGNSQITYSLTVTNLSTADATGVTVTDDLPDQVEFVSDNCGGADVPPWTWAIGDLAAGASATCELTVDVVESGEITNVSAVQADQDEITLDNNEDTTTVTVPPSVDLAIDKTGTLDEDAGQITYTLTVTNNGPDDATGVTVTDDLPAQVEFASDTCGGADVPPWTWTIGALASGASATCDLTVDIVAAGEIANASEVTGNEEDPDLDNNEDDETIVVIDLAIEKTAAVSADNSQITYTLTVTNTGPDDATGVTVTDDLPAQVEFVSDNCGGADIPPWTWTIGDLAAGGSATCALTVDVVAGGEITNVSAVEADQGEITLDNNEDTTTVTVPPSVDLAIDKTGTLDEDGEQITYTLTVTNTGPDDATGVTVTDDLPDEVEFVSDNCGGADIPPWTWTIGDLAAGDSATCALTVDVVAGGEITNVSAVEADQGETTLENNEDTATVNVAEVADLAVEKVASDTSLSVGDQFTYTLTVTNNGPDDATGVTVTDDLPSQVDFVSDNCGGTDVPPWRWTIGDLAGGHSTTCTLTVKALASGSPVNTARVSGDQDDPEPDDDTSTAAVSIAAALGPPQLPRTGASAIAVLLVLGAGLAALGTLAVLSSRRAASRRARPSTPLP